MNDLERAIELTRLSKIDEDILTKQAEYHEAWQRLHGVE